MPKTTKAPQEGAPLKPNKNKQLDKKRGREGAPPQTDYSKYKIDYGEIDRKLAEVAFDQRVPNTHIYYLLGWSKSKFYGVCKANVSFVGYLETKREQARVETLRDMQDVVITAAKNGNVVAAFFALKALGVHDVPLPPPKDDERPKDDTLDLKDCTLAEMKQIKRICERVDKRRNAKAKKVEV